MGEIRTREEEWDERSPCRRDSIVYGMHPGLSDDPTAGYITYPSNSFGTSGSWGQRRMFDVAVSNFKARIKRGEIINNPMTKTVHEYVSEALTRHIEFYRIISYNFQDFDWKHGRKWYGTYGADYLLGYPHHPTTFSLAEPTVDEQYYQQLAVTNAYSRIDTSAVASLVTAGEMNESIRFIYDTGKRMVRIFQAIRKFNLSALRKQISLKEISKRYMEYRYALRPMMNDISNYYSAITELSREVRQTYRDRQLLADFDEGSEFQAAEDSTGYIYAKERIDVKFIARAGVLCSVDVDRLDRWGTTKVWDAAWELIPFSFIADWFFNIGNTIASFTPEQGVKELASWCSVAKVVTREIRVTRTVQKPSPMWTEADGAEGLMDHIYHFCSGGAIQHKMTSYVRVPQPKRSYLPSWKLRLNGWKLLDLGIILKQLSSNCFKC